MEGTASVLDLDNPVSITFYSLRRSSAMAAAEHPFSSLWIFMDGLSKHASLKNVSSSKASVKSMADKLQGPSSQIEKTEVRYKFGVFTTQPCF